MTGHDAHRRRGLALVAGSAVIWSTGGWIVRSLDVEDPWTIVAYRSLFATVALTLAVLVQHRGGAPAAVRRMGRPGLLVGACFAVASISFVLALDRTSVAHVLVVVSTAPLVAAVLGRIVLGEVVRPRTWVAAGTTVLGVVVIATGTGGGASRSGDAIALVIPLVMATATVTIRRHDEVVMVPAMAVGTALALVVALVVGGGLPGVGARDLVLLAVFGGLQLGGGMALYAVGARLVPAADVALVSLLEPVLAPLWVWWFADEAPGTPAIVGGIVVLGAMALHTVADLRGRTAPAVA